MVSQQHQQQLHSDPQEAPQQCSQKSQSPFSSTKQCPPVPQVVPGHRGMLNWRVAPPPWQRLLQQPLPQRLLQQWKHM